MERAWGSCAWCACVYRRRSGPGNTPLWSAPRNPSMGHLLRAREAYFVWVTVKLLSGPWQKRSLSLRLQDRGHAPAGTHRAPSTASAGGPDTSSLPWAPGGGGRDPSNPGLDLDAMGLEFISKLGLGSLTVPRHSSKSLSCPFVNSPGYRVLTPARNPVHWTLLPSLWEGQLYPGHRKQRCEELLLLAEAK